MKVGGEGWAESYTAHAHAHAYACIVSPIIEPLGGGILGSVPLSRESTSIEFTKVLSGDQWSVSVGMSLRSVCTTTCIVFGKKGWGRVRRDFIYRPPTTIWRPLRMAHRPSTALCPPAHISQLPPPHLKPSQPNVKQRETT